MGNIPPPSYSDYSDVNQNQHSRQETPSPVGFQQQEAHQSQQNETSQQSVESDINVPSTSWDERGNGGALIKPTS